MTHVLITGCNRGLGREMVKCALARGWQVTGTAREGADVPDIPVLRCDMSNPEALGSVFADLPPLDVLINNAGVLGPDDGPLEAPLTAFEELFAVNTLAPLAVARACLPALRQGSSPRILSVSTQMSYMGYRKPNAIAYRASKAALNKIMQGLATELEPEGITALLVDPGWARTDMGGPNADDDPVDVAHGIIALAERVRMPETGKFFRFTGEERDF